MEKWRELWLACRMVATEKILEAHVEALLWCGGSEDFQICGRARSGWNKICAPLLRMPWKTWK